MKWAEIATSSKVRAEILSDFLNEFGFSNSLNLISPPSDALGPFLKKLKDDHDQIRFSPSFGAVLMEELPAQSLRENGVRTCDVLLQERGLWWPRSLLYEALTQLLLQAPFTIQFQDSVLIVGTGAVARVAVSVLFKTGFRHFLVAAISENEAQDFIIEMSRTLLGVKFTTVPFQQLVHLTSGCSLVVNASPVQDSNFILPELLYFNFLRQEGWVWDFNLEPVRHPFIEEAVELGLRVLRGYEIAASVDGIWVELVFGRSFDCQTYQDRLLKALLK